MRRILLSVNESVSGQQWSDIVSFHTTIRTPLTSQAWISLYSLVLTLFFLVIFFLRSFLSPFLRRCIYWSRIYRQDDGAIDRDFASSTKEKAQSTDQNTSQHALAFFAALLSTPNSAHEKALSERLDLESYLFLRLLRLCVSICLLGTFVLAPALCPLYAILGDESDHSKRASFERMTAASVKKGSCVLWAPLVAMFILVAHTLFAILTECEVYERARKRWAVRAHRKYGATVTSESSVPPRQQREHSAYIERIPLQHSRSDAALFAYLNNLFPGMIDSVVICKEIPSALREVYSQRERAVANLEKKMVVIESFAHEGSNPEIDVSIERQELERLNTAVAAYNSESDAASLNAIKCTATPEVEDATTQNYGALNPADDDDGGDDEQRLMLTSTLEQASKALAVALQNVTLGSRASQSGFVTFNKLQAALVCRSLKRFTATYRRAFDVADIAPDRDDVYWDNIDESADSVDHRSTLFAMLIFFVTLEWYLVLLACYALATHIHSENSLIEYMVSYMPVLSVNALLALLPYLLLSLSVKYEKMKFDSRANLLVLQRYFAFQLVNIYVTIFTGSVLSEIADLIKHPATALSVLAKELPLTAGYFVELVVCKTLIVLPFELARLLPIIRSAFALCVGRKRCSHFAEKDIRVKRWSLAHPEYTLTRRELRNPPFEPLAFRFSFQYPSILMVILIAFVFAAIAPAAFPFCLMYFLSALFVYNWQMHHVYVSPHSSAGVYFVPALVRLLGGLTAACVVFIAYLGLKEAYWQLLIALVLPCATAYYQLHISSTYGSLATASMSLEYANKVDRAYSGQPCLFDAEYYRQPQLRRQSLKPERQRAPVEESGEEATLCN